MLKCFVNQIVFQSPNMTQVLQVQLKIANERMTFHQDRNHK